VEDAYETFLKRPATQAELNQGARPQTSSTTLYVNILSSREFYKKQGGGTIDGFLTALGNAWFGTPFPASIQTRLASALRHGVPRSKVVQGVITSPPGIRAELNTIYETILDRPVDQRGVAQFSSFIKRGQVVPVMVALFGSKEFSDKFVNIV
jgi:hypothetical protein